MTAAVREKVRKNKGESQYRQTLAKFGMSPCSLYGGLKAERHLDSLEREATEMQREGCECGKSNFCAQ